MSWEASGSAGARMRRGEPASDRLHQDPSTTAFDPGLSHEVGRASREHAPGLDGHRTVGFILALGATFGAAGGAAIGVISGDVGHWMGMGIPVGISVGLAVGAICSRPARRGQMSGASTTPWAGTDDDSVLRPPRSLN